jgi:3-phosphoshikimate 1-carboxyvinyltransferase
MQTASAQVKSALLLSGLYASGPTELTEPTISRDHTERMLGALGVPIETGSRIRLDPHGWLRELPAFQLEIPGDLSAAAFIVAAGLLVAGSKLELCKVGVNPSRSGVLDWLKACGFDIQLADHAVQNGEPTATLHVAFARGHSSRVAGDLLVRAIDEVPAICAIAAGLDGETTIADAQELRVKESDRIRTSAAVLRAFGIEVDEHADGLTVRGQPEGKLKQCTIDSHGDHRIAMMAAVLALRAEGECCIRDVACVDTSFPRFAETMHAIGAQIDIR